MVANLSSGYDVRMGGIASYLLGDEEYDDTLCRVCQVQSMSDSWTTGELTIAMPVSAFEIPKWTLGQCT